mgnify:CR=1 FL=1
MMKLSEYVPTKVTLDYVTWVSLYDRLTPIVSKSMAYDMNWEANADDVRDEVLNLMNFYFDKGFEVGLTKYTKVTIHE